MTAIFGQPIIGQPIVLTTMMSMSLNIYQPISLHPSHNPSRLLLDGTVLSIGKKLIGNQKTIIVNTQQHTRCKNVQSHTMRIVLFDTIVDLMSRKSNSGVLFILLLICNKMSLESMYNTVKDLPYFTYLKTSLNQLKKFSNHAKN